MEVMRGSDLAVFFPADERDAAELVRQSCKASVRLLRDCWGLATPRDCRVYVMTSPLQFLWLSAPWEWRILFCLSVPLWYWRVWRLWHIAGGWSQYYGRRTAVGVKPPRLIQAAGRSIGERIFTRVDDPAVKVQQITCHELTHAFSAHLRLPAWLNEGLAMVTVDRLFGTPTVRPQTIETLAAAQQEVRPRGYRRLQTGDPDALVRHYVRGYWITRYLAETQPELLGSLLRRRHSRRHLEDRLAAALGMERVELWQRIDRAVAAHFRPQ